MSPESSGEAHNLERGSSSANNSHASDIETLFTGGGELGALMRSKDWAQTPLGPVNNWPQNLKTCVRIVLTSRQPMFVWWGEELINLYNDAYKSIVGGKHPTALGQPARIVWSEIWDQIGSRAATAMRANEGTYDESLLLIMERYGYQEETYYTFSYSPVPNDQGGTGGIICANTDDTQRILNERQMMLLRELAARTVDARSWQEACALSARSMASNSRDICFALIYIADSSKTSVELAGSTGIEAGTEDFPLNAPLDSASGWPLAQALGSHEIHVVPGVGERLRTIPAAAWDRPVHSVALVPIAPSGPNGRSGVLVVGLNPFRQFDERYRGFLKLIAGQISASIANAAAYEEERRRAEALAELDRAKTTFFSNVSHEFRTPLTLMLGPLEDILASPQGELPASTRQEVEVVHRNGIRLLKLVNALLDFSTIEAGRISAHYEPVDLTVLTGELASVFRSAMERSGLRYIVTCESLPERVYVDRGMWEKVVLNLLSNALKFTLNGEVEVSLRSNGSRAELTVRDTGLGIPESELPQIFERFHRVAGAQGRTHEGTGIGLALVDELVRLHGGTVQVESHLGTGTKFTVAVRYGSAHLPAERIVAARTPKSLVAEASPYVQEALRWLPDSRQTETLPIRDSGNEDLTALSSGRTSATVSPSGRVLLADDNRDMREYVERLLARKYDVITANNGREALELARSHSPDVILTDVMMPEMDGFELLKALRSDPRTMLLPVIMLSARAGEESRAEGMEAGADDYLVKPFTARELMARVGAHLSMKQLRQEFSLREQREHQRAEAAEAQYRRILENISEAFIFVDPEWSIRYVNEIAARFSRRTTAELIGANFWEQFPDIVDSQFGLAFRQAMESQQRLEVEEYYEPLDAWFHVHIYPTADGLSLFSADVTAQRRQQKALLVSEKLATAGRLASTVAHEINNPLESVINLLYLARTTTVIEDKDRYVEWAEREINRVAHIARQTLGFYRESAQLAKVSVSSAIESLLQVYQGKLRARKITVSNQVEGDLKVTARSGELNQVLSNLITNSIDACGEGGHLTIGASPSTQADREGVEITVVDDGVGIPRENITRVFEPFFTTKKDVGTGLGLWVVKQIIEGHQGAVTVESSTEPERHGTTVRLFLPENGEARAQAAEASSSAV